MNNLFTKKAIQANKTSQRNTLSFALCAATLLSSSSVFANRPAMEGRSEISNEVSSETNSEVVETQSEMRSETRPETLPEAQQAEPSSVETMMQQQNQQTYQTYQTGDVVQLPAKELQPGETLKIQLLDFPRRGMSMDKVQFSYGQPISISESVGKPPITHWTYNDRVVYFEYSTVLHVVAR